jgi:hypothetical protein
MDLMFKVNLLTQLSDHPLTQALLQQIQPEHGNT